MEIAGTRGQILMAKYPLPIPYPLGSYGASTLGASLASSFWRRHCLLGRMFATSGIGTDATGRLEAADN